LSQHEVAAALSAANVSFSMLGSLCGPLVSGALVPDVYQFVDVTSIQAIFTGACYTLPLVFLQRYKQMGNRARPCSACVSCLACCNSLCCPCCKCCQAKGEPVDSAELAEAHAPAAAAARLPQSAKKGR